MKTLGIETSGNVGSVAICEGNSIIAEQSFEKGMRHGKELIPSIKSIFEENGFKPGDIDLIAVDVGPGSYTGIRVGITCAKTLAYSLNKPVIDVTSLDAISQNITNVYKFICPVLDARREKVYSCIYESALDDNLPGNSTTEISQPVSLWKKVSKLSLISPDELIKALPDGSFVFGDGVARHTELFDTSNFLTGDIEYGIPKAAFVAILGSYDFAQGRECDAKTLLPLYLSEPAVLEKLAKDKIIKQ